MIIIEQKLERRRFLGCGLAAASVALSGCQSRLQDEIDFRCTGKQAELNKNLCSQLKIRSNFATELSLAILTGALIGAVIGTAAARNPVAGAIIGGTVAGSIGLAKNYLDHKILESRNDRDLALKLVKADLRTDIRYLQLTLLDIQAAQKKLEIAIRQEGEKLSKRFTTFEDAALIKENAEKNIESFKGASTGYRQIRTLPINLDREYQDLSNEIQERTRESEGHFILLKEKYGDFR